MVFYTNPCKLAVEALVSEQSRAQVWVASKQTSCRVCSTPIHFSTRWGRNKGWGVIQILSDRDDGMGAKVKTQKNSYGFKQTSQKPLPNFRHKTFQRSYAAGITKITKLQTRGVATCTPGTHVRTSEKIYIMNEK